MPANRINNNEPNRRRPYQRNTARRSTPLPANLDLVKSKIENAIRNQNEEPEEPIEEDWPIHPANIIGQAKRNMSIYQNQYNIHQHTTNFIVGHALDNISEPDDWEGINLGPTEIQIARRTYRMFKDWPKAIQHLGNLTARQWRILSQAEDELIYQEMKNKYRGEPSPNGESPNGESPNGESPNGEPLPNGELDEILLNELLNTYPIIFN